MLITNYILILVVLVCFYFIYNLLRKVEKLEEISISRELFITMMNDQLEHAIKKIDDIDNMGIYRYNEEFGTFYDELLECSKLIKGIIGGYSDQQQ